MSDGLNGAVERVSMSPIWKAWVQLLVPIIGAIIATLLGWTLTEVIGLRNDLTAVQIQVTSDHENRLDAAELEIRANREELRLRTRDRFTTTNAEALEERILAEVERLRADIQRLADQMRGQMP